MTRSSTGVSVADFGADGAAEAVRVGARGVPVDAGHQLLHAVLANTPGRPDRPPRTPTSTTTGPSGPARRAGATRGRWRCEASGVLLNSWPNDVTSSAQVVAVDEDELSGSDTHGQRLSPFRKQLDRGLMWRRAPLWIDSRVPWISAPETPVIDVDQRGIPQRHPRSSCSIIMARVADARRSASGAERVAEALADRHLDAVESGVELDGPLQGAGVDRDGAANLLGHPLAGAGSSGSPCTCGVELPGQRPEGALQPLGALQLEPGGEAALGHCVTSPSPECPWSTSARARPGSR